MFFNRIYFTSRQTYRRLKYNRNLVTFNSPNGGQGGPNFDYIVTVFVMGSGFYWINKKR